jgi:hypothetical protein
MWKVEYACGMSENITPRPPQTPSRWRKLSESLSSWFIKETIGNASYDGLIVLGKRAVKLSLFVTFIVGYLRYRLGISPDALVIGGLFVAAITAAILVRLLARVLLPKTEAPQIDSAALALQSRDQTPLAAIKEPCPDKWLHELADTDRKCIEKFVNLQKCEIGRHDLLAEQYVEFKFAILNASVYDVEIGEDDGKVRGDVYLNSRLLSRDKRITKDSTRYYKHGESGSLIVRQWLSPEEVKDFLSGVNKAGEFRLKGLEIAVKGGSPESDVLPKTLEVYGRSVSGESLWELYQELGIEIQQATFTVYWDYPDRGDKSQYLGIPEYKGLLFNIHVRIVNPRSIQVKLRSFRLIVKIKGKDYAADAEVGAVIYEDRIIKEGIETLRGQKFENLNPPHDRPLVIEARKECDGRLQFILQGIPFEAIKKDIESASLEGIEIGFPATLAISNESGETHRSEEYQLSYVISYNS